MMIIRNKVQTLCLHKIAKENATSEALSLKWSIHQKKFHEEAKLKLCMIEQRSWCKMQMQKGISEKGQQCLKKAFNVVP
jgi:hypothetical protein